MITWVSTVDFILVPYDKGATRKDRILLCLISSTVTSSNQYVLWMNEEYLFLWVGSVDNSSFDNISYIPVGSSFITQGLNS